MAGTNPDLVVRVAANIAALQTDMAAAAASVKGIEGAVVSAQAAGQGWMASLDGLGHSWVARIAEGELLRDAIREVVAKMKELVEYFPELAMRGSVVGDVEESFKHLAEQAGHTSDVLLGTLRAGTHGTIDDFALMQRANKDLAAGLDLTDQQMGLLSQGAFALAKATGTDTKNALDTMSDAMVTGKAKAVALLTGKIDLKAAEDAFAASLGATKDELTAEGKLEADRQAILAGVERGLARVGEQTDSLDEKVTQAKVAWANFEDELGKTIAQSPVLAAGLDSVRASLLQAFGGDQKKTIDDIASAVVNAAIVVVDFGIALGLMAGVAVQLWNGIKTAVLAVETGIVGLVTGIGEVLLAADKMANKLHLVDDSEVAKIQATQDALRGMTVGLAAETAEAARAAAGHSELGTAIDRSNGILLTARDAMLAAQDAQKVQTAATTAFVGPLQEASDGVKAHGEFLRVTAAEAKHLADLEAAAILQIAELWAKSDEADIARGRARLKLDETAAADRAAVELAYDQARVDKGLMTESQFLQVKSGLEQQAYQRHLDLLKAEEAADELSNGVKLDAELAKTNERYDKGLLSKQEYEEEYAAIEARFAILRESLQDAYYAHVTEAQQKQVAQQQTITKASIDTTASISGMSMATAAFSGDLNSQAKSVETLAGAWITAAEAKKQFDMGNTLDVGHAAQDPRIMAFLKAGWSLANAEALKQGEDWGFSPKLFDPLGNPETAPSKGERVPGYKDGGPTVEGLSMLHGGEYVVPEGGALVTKGGGGTVVNNYYNITHPLGTPAQIAKAVDDATMQRQRNIGVRY